MEWKLVVDSGSSLLDYPNLPENVGFQNVPMNLQADDDVIVDDGKLPLREVLDRLHDAKQTGSACPAPGEFVEAFKGADNVICVTITGTLSGTYNAAMLGAKMVREENPDANIFVLDSKSAGPAQDMHLERALAGIKAGKTFDEVVADLTAHRDEGTGTCFLLRSVDNLVKNGRVSKLIGSLVDLMNLRLVGFGSPGGTIELAQRARGDKRGQRGLLKEMESSGFVGGRVRIYDILNREQATEMKERILAKYPDCEVELATGSGLCGYYAEDGGLIIGYEI